MHVWRSGGSIIFHLFSLGLLIYMGQSWISRARSGVAFGVQVVRGERQETEGTMGDSLAGHVILDITTESTTMPSPTKCYTSYHESDVCDVLLWDMSIC